MKKILFSFLMLSTSVLLAQQDRMTPELLWSLGRISVTGYSPDQQTILYSVKSIDIKTEKSSTRYYLLDLINNTTAPTHILGKKTFVQWDKNGLYAREKEKLWISKDHGKTWKIISTVLKDATHVRVSPDGNWIAYSSPVTIEKNLGRDIYGDLDKSTVQVYTNLNYRHWDEWNHGKVSHVFLASLNDRDLPAVDILENEPYDCPQKPFGGKEDFIFSPDSKSVLYVSKKKSGKEYAQSTNTDIYQYNISDQSTLNLTEGMMGYDVNPVFSNDGHKLAWLSMKRDGYEADKNDIIVMDVRTRKKHNLTAEWDETVDGGILWSADNKSIFFSASLKGTQQLFKADMNPKSQKEISQITKGNFNVTNLVLHKGNSVIAGRTDFNHATELFNISLKDGKMAALTEVNAKLYDNIKKGTSNLEMVTTKDGKEMGVWVIYPPDFDSSKKYPTLLYCQGGPQSALSQFYSFRWNFQLMAANGYIIVAPNRRGMPGWGVKWNESISKDWGGKPIQDYLDAIDAIAKKPYVDQERIGCVGASYGGYSVFQLAGIHNNRFSTFIAHDGLFNLKSWYGTTEELWFANWDLGGNYWQDPMPLSYQKFDPSANVAKWNTPMLIIQGGLDFRVPVGQGLEAFQAAQLKGLKSKLLYFPDENHWILKPHNGLAWQREFFSWLKETL